MKLILGLLTALALIGCVHEADLKSWQGQPVVELDKHPIFLSIPTVRTVASDGTEIRNYVNGRNVASCSGGGTVFAGNINMATYQQFSSCMSAFAACNNIFYIKDGVIQRYTPIGTGGAICYTNADLRPGFNQPTNFR